MWSRRGRVLGIVVSSNHPMTFTSALTALGLGYRVVVQPGRRDPFTPLRLARALAEAGLAPLPLAVLPGSPEAADALIDAVDRAIVHGDREAVARHAGAARVLVRGPGCSKVLVDEGAAEDPAVLDLLVTSIAGDGGVRSTNATAIFVAGEIDALAVALAERLAALPLLPCTDPRAALAALPITEARGVLGVLEAHLEGERDLCRAFHDGEPVVPVGGGAAILRPSLIATPDPARAARAPELPFPCAWIAPWSRRRGLAPLRDSLALTLVTRDAALVGEALSDPTIRKVLWGRIPTVSARPGAPHDGYLSEFLMTARGFEVEGS